MSSTNPMVVETRDWNGKQFVCRLLREDARKLHAELSAYLERTETVTPYHGDETHKVKTTA